MIDRTYFQIEQFWEKIHNALFFIILYDFQKYSKVIPNNAKYFLYVK